MVVDEMDALKRKCDEKEDQLVVLRKRAKELQDKKNNFNAQHAQQLIDISAFCFSRLQFCTVLRYKKIYCSKVWKDKHWNHWNKACVCWSVYAFLGNEGLKREKKPFLNNFFTFCLEKIRSFRSIIRKI